MVISAQYAVSKLTYTTQYGVPKLTRTTIYTGSDIDPPCAGWFHPPSEPPVHC
jgi:hypothetical protein